MRAFRLALVTGVVAIACTAKDGPSGGTSAGRVAIGTTVPAYAAATLAGEPTSLAAKRGTVVLLNVWATWCHPCREEIPELRVLDSLYRTRGLEVIGVSVDSDGTDEVIRAFLSEFKMGYTIWRDSEERVMSLFTAVGVPATFLIDRAGVLQWRHTGPFRRGDPTLATAIERALAASTDGR